MAERILTVSAENGLHAQASAKVVQLLSHFESAIQMALGGRVVNAKSIMGVMLLAAGPGKQITVTATGIDADQALDALEQLFISQFKD